MLMRILAHHFMILLFLVSGCINQSKHGNDGASLLDQPDIHLLTADLIVPPVIAGNAGPGRRVKQTLPSYLDTEVHHLLYLPTNWVKESIYPVIVEYPGNGPYQNDYGDLSTGKVDGCNLGFGISGGEDFIWISLPFISLDGQRNQDQWWGDVEATKRYCLETVKSVCNNFGGDTSAVILSGFSRGAIAVNYIGLYDDEIASQWLAFIAHSHYDGVKKWGYHNDDPAAAIARMRRLGGRPQFISHEDHGITETRDFIDQSGIKGDFTFVDLPYRNHTSAWVLRNIPEREVIRNWLADVLLRRGSHISAQ